MTNQHWFADCRKEEQRNQEGAFDNLPPGTSPLVYLQYVEMNWDLLASFAYDSFLRDGKGILILDWDLTMSQQFGRNFATRQASNYIHCPIFYMGKRSKLLNNGRGFTAEWTRCVDAYDPETTLILGLSWGYIPPVGHFMMRTLGAGKLKDSGAGIDQGMTPKAIYERSRDRLCEFYIS